MSIGGQVGDERGGTYDVAYLILSGTTTAARCPEILRGLVDLGFKTVITIPTPNASRVLAPRDLADVPGVTLAESYFDLSIRPRPPHGVVVFAPFTWNAPLPDWLVADAQGNLNPHEVSAKLAGMLQRRAI